MADNEIKKIDSAEQNSSDASFDTENTVEGRKTERVAERIDQQQSRQKETQPTRYHLPQIRKPHVIPSVKDEIYVKIEKIMEEGMNDAFQRLSPIAQQEFKIKGEKTATKINELLRSTHVKAKQIFRLIIEWLKMLPGVNKFFLEQEAKIKTDKILEIKKRKL